MKLKSFLTFSAILAIFYLPKQLDACRLFGALADDGFTLNNSGNENFNYAVVSFNGINVLNDQGSVHNSGWGLAWYTPERLETYRQNTPANESDYNHDPYIYRLKDFSSGVMLAQNASAVNVVMGHIRLASSGCGVSGDGTTDLPDPHPWVWEAGFQGAPATYTFSHNGSLDPPNSQVNKQALANLIGYDWLLQNGGLETFGEYQDCGGDWTESLDNVIDSEVYFKWIMKNIQENDYNVLPGIHQALSNDTFKDEIASVQSINFLFSDGNALWAFRRPASSEPSDPNIQHTLFWACKEGTVNSAPVGVKLVMSQPTSGQFQTVWNEIAPDELVYLPRSGNVVSFQNFAGSQVNHVEVKPFNKSWNWVGFPVLPDNNATDITAVLGDLAPDALSVQHEVYNQFPLINYDLFNGNWPPFNMNSVKGYKVLMSSAQAQYNLALAGTRVDPATTIELHAGTNWVDYFLPETQDIFDALPDEVLSVLSSVKFQDWYKYWNGYKWVTKIYNTTACPIGQGASCTTAKYGAMYEITVNSPITFQWQIGAPQPPSGTRSVELSSFRVTQQPDYSPVTLTNIQDQGSVQEVGLFLGETCIGATAVSDTQPIDIQAYNGTQSLNDVLVQVVRSGGGLAKGTPGNRTVVAKHAFKPANISFQRLPNGDRSYTVDLSNAEEIPADFQLHLTAYPNPFNPSTTVQFYLVAASQVNLTVYDIMGREVETLNAGRLESGNHRFTWNGSARPSGIYFVRLSTAQKHETRKIILMK